MLPAPPSSLALVGAWLATRLGFLAWAGMAFAFLPRGRFFGEVDSLASALLRWDAGWYLGLINGAYQYSPGQASNVAFFPLYPLLCRPLATVVGGAAAGVIVSLGALLGACVVMEKWIQQLPLARERPGLGRTASWLLLLCPLTIFHSTVYSESLYLLLTAVLLWALERRWWCGVALAGGLATLTRSAGVMLVVLVAWRWWELRRAAPGSAPVWGLLAGLAAPAVAVGGYMGFLAWRFGEPLAFAQTQAAWKRGLTWPWRTLLPEHLKIYPPFYLLWFLGFLGLAVVLLWFGRKRGVPSSYLAYGSAAVLFFLSSGRLESCPRYLSALLPLYLVGAVLIGERPGVQRVTFAVSTLLAATSVWLFTNGFWFT